MLSRHHRTKANAVRLSGYRNTMGTLPHRAIATTLAGSPYACGHRHARVDAAASEGYCHAKANATALGATARQSWPAIAITKILSYQACTPAGSESGQARTSQGTQPPAAVAPLTLPLFSTSDTTNGLELLAAAATENTGNYQPGPQLRSFCLGLAHSTCSITITQGGEAHTGPRNCRDVGGDSR